MSASASRFFFSSSSLFYFSSYSLLKSAAVFNCAILSFSSAIIFLFYFEILPFDAFYTVLDLQKSESSYFSSVCGPVQHPTIY